MNTSTLISAISELNRIRLRSLSGMRKHFSCDGQQSIIYRTCDRRERQASLCLEALEAVYRNRFSR